MKKKITALFLALALIISVAPAIAAASAVTGQDMADKAMEHLDDTIKDFPGISFDWCAYFTTYVASELGLCSSPDNPTGKLFPPIERSTWERLGWAVTSCASQINWFTSNKHGTLYHFGLNRSLDKNRNTVLSERGTFTPQVGDLIYFNHDGVPCDFCHVAIVTGFDPDNGEVFYVGGNQDNTNIYLSHVSLRADDLYNTEKIAGFLRPDYPTTLTDDDGQDDDISSHHLNCPSAKFKDVSVDSWFHDDLDLVMDYGLFYGTSETTFSPGATMTRGMIISVLYRLDGSPDVSDVQIPFKDVSDTAWYLDAVKWAYANEISVGLSNDEYGANKKITRAQAAKMLYGYALYKGYDCSAYMKFDGFIDASSVAAWAADAMHWALASGMIVGTSRSMISPNGNATRAQVSAIFARYIRYFDISSESSDIDPVDSGTETDITGPELPEIGGDSRGEPIPVPTDPTLKIK